MGIVLSVESYAVQGAAFEVYRQMGPGFLEVVYQECLELELADRQIPFSRGVLLPLSYKGRHLRRYYRLDLVCYDRIVVEIKSVTALSNRHRAQTINYLTATGLPLAILMNFNHYPRIELERIVARTG